MLQNPLQLTPVVIVTRRDEKGEQLGTLYSGFFKRLRQIRALENKEQLWPIYAVLLKDFCSHYKMLREGFA